MGAAAVDLCSVACGRVDAFFERGLNHWDLAAGALIAIEAGAIVSSIEGGPPRPARCSRHRRRCTSRCWHCWRARTPRTGSDAPASALPARPSCRGRAPASRKTTSATMRSRCGQMIVSRTSCGRVEQVPRVEPKHPAQHDPDRRQPMQAELDRQGQAGGDSRAPQVVAEAKQRERIGDEAGDRERRVQGHDGGRCQAIALGRAEVGRHVDGVGEHVGSVGRGTRRRRGRRPTRPRRGAQCGGTGPRRAPPEPPPGSGSRPSNRDCRGPGGPWAPE